MNLIKGVIYGIFGQILSFMQLQGTVKYGWSQNYMWLVLLTSIPSTWLYIKSVENLVLWGNGELWPSRLIGFGIGIIIFVTMSMILFKEPITLKTLICLLLAVVILCVQIFWK